MPINLDSRQNKNWKSTLRAALDRLNDLNEMAENLHANSDRYIRPIMLVQVERTGDDQHDGKNIHANDVKKWLTTAGDLREEEVAEKTSRKNDLKAPENQDLLSESNLIRVIITKQALQEGWDCPFAYVLCSLTASHSLTAMTQLVGRILRQPYAEKTGVSELDECYIVTHHAGTNCVVEGIKEGLQKEGLKDLQNLVNAGTDGENAGTMRQTSRRLEFTNLPIYLPNVLRVDKNEQRMLDYETDILYRLDWINLDVSEFVSNKIPKYYRAASRQLYQIDLDETRKGELNFPSEIGTFDGVRIVKRISDIVPNAWIAWDIVDRVRQGLIKRKFSPKKLGKMSHFIGEKLYEWLEDQRDIKAECLFIKEVEAGAIQFRLRADAKNWKMPQIIETSNTDETKEFLDAGQPTQKSLFTPVYDPDFNTQERKVALYMDNYKTMHWWHRNVARQQYHIQGWKRNKIYPDFICSVQQKKNGYKFAVLETKGGHLAGNSDTEYKRKVLELMEKSFQLERNVTPVGEMELLIKDGTRVLCKMVMMKGYDTELPKILSK